MIAVECADVRGVRDVLIDLHCAALITDPPYAERVHSKATNLHSKDTRGVRKRDLGFAHLDEDTRAAIVAVAQSVSGWTAVFSDIETAHLWHAPLSAKPLEYVRTVPWVRWSQPQLSGDRPPSGCELVTLAHPRRKKTWSGPGSLTAFDTRSLRGADKYSCEKPLDIMLALVSWFSEYGSLICDPCCGAGTTGLAARLLGRDAILLDADPSAVDIASKRCDSALSERDIERARRWIEYQRAWLATPEPDTESGAARYARARADTDRVETALK